MKWAPRPSDLLHWLVLQIINLITNRCVRVIGKQESVRFLNLALYQGVVCARARKADMHRRRHPVIPPRGLRQTHQDGSGNTHD